ncbi:DnaD domain-containing protein [Bacillus toyonensis]|uniref:Primosomal replication protein N n=1 Tax=Bacillus toyonensis TaxID=155322 RepID=A0A2B6QAA5_9BACI|nr:DnaD domain protein [Bacillus toyonensis]PEJ91420.1 primosomal replication protein N [Bacillus toyonensis]PEK83511.1 primosomal replication protein N [Bacillus toyonensis]PEL22364.1 primosomal replication protein N [Bacillus toyonensis]PEO61697.1 primosomal replication protein N [Bacillus toyonensis]PFY36714.1 primosomal replication protein N [Bacillus toyonensis]
MANVVYEIGGINFKGNVVDHEWFNYITFSNGKPHIVAIMVLSEIVYWYRPTVIRDEIDGKVTYKKKFKADKLQKNYQQLADTFGFTKLQVKRACDLLTDMLLIKIEFRTISVNGKVLNNVMFVEPVPTEIKQISSMYQQTKEAPDYLEVNRVDTCKLTPSSLTSKESPDFKVKTNTESTTNITTNINNDDTATSSQKLIDQEFKISYNFLLKQGIPLSEIAIQELGEFCDRFGNELITHAVNKAIDENVPKWRYIRSILSSWEKAKVKTLNDVAALDTRFEMSKGKNKRTGKGYSKRTEVVPDWLREQEEDEPIQQPPQTQNDDPEDNKKRLDEILNKYKNTKGV